GHQPIHNEDRRIWVVFNGEIYNFPELRPKLEARGHRFYTNSDTEIIVHLYEEYGAECVKKLRGMFALAVWDQRGEKLLLARDRFGKKPLHYGMDGGRFLFGSEIKAILAAAPRLAEVAHHSLLGFLHFGYIADPYTCFKSIKKLPPGHLLEFSDGRVRVQKYWDLPAYGTYEPQSEQECLEQLEHRLAEAVRVRLISDVPLGTLLSGGVDSSIVPTYHVCRLARQHVTVALTGDGGDELFAGYDRYGSYLGRRRIRPFSFALGRWYREHVHPIIPMHWHGRRLVYNLSLPPRERYLDEISTLPTSWRETDIFSKDFLAWANRQPSPYEGFRQLLENGPATDA